MATGRTHLFIASYPIAIHLTARKKSAARLPGRPLGAGVQSRGRAQRASSSTTCGDAERPQARRIPGAVAGDSQTSIPTKRALSPSPNRARNAEEQSIEPNWRGGIIEQQAERQKPRPKPRQRAR